MRTGARRLLYEPIQSCKPLCEYCPKSRVLYRLQNPSPPPYSSPKRCWQVRQHLVSAPCPRTVSGRNAQYVCVGMWE